MDLHFLLPKLMEDWICTFQHTVTLVSLSGIIDLGCYNNFSTLPIQIYKFNADHIAITKCINGSFIALDLWLFGAWIKWKTNWQTFTEFGIGSLMRLRTVLFTLRCFKSNQFLVYMFFYSLFAMVICNFSVLLSYMFWSAPASYFSSKPLFSVSMLK